VGRVSAPRVGGARGQRRAAETRSAPTCTEAEVAAAAAAAAASGRSHFGSGGHARGMSKQIHR